MTTPEVHPDRPSWLAARRGSLGASELADILGMGEHGSPLQVYRRHRAHLLLQPEPEWEGTDDMQAGSIFEESAAKLYEARTGRKIVTLTGSTTLYRHPTLRMHSSPDAIQVREDGTPGVLELKWQRFRRTWADGPPLGYAIQGVAHAMCTGLPATVAAVVGGFDLYHHDLGLPAELVELIEERVADFWRAVERGHEPPATARDLPMLRDWYADSFTGVTVDLSEEMADFPDRIQAALDAEKQAKDEVKYLKARAMQALKDGGTLLIGGRKVATWTKKKQPIMKKVGERTVREFRWGMRGRKSSTPQLEMESDD
jgi:predicted phage-related endonuclease